MNYKDLTGKSKEDSDEKWNRILKKWYSKIPTKNNHYRRNVKNINLPKDQKDAEFKGYKRIYRPGDNCHQFSAPNKILKRNRKYVSGNNRKEIIFNYTGKKVITDDRDVGTYNNGKGITEHFWKDVIPWLKWGNTKKDFTTRRERIIAYGTDLLPYPKKRVEEVLDSLPD